MAIVKREKNCGNCDNCVTGGNATRFRCNALPANPKEWWDGYPVEHWCASNWVEKKEVPSKITAKSEK